MDSKTNIPSFTVSLRGYDRVEVDEYLDSLADALSQVDDAQEQNRRLQAHIGRLNGRIKDLEDRISADTPKTGAILAERIGIMLRSAEETATDTMERAEVRSAELIAEAEKRVAEAEEASRVTVAGGQEQARRIEASARAEAAEIISEAESRAAARTRQIEQWAEQVVSHTRAEEARMLREQQTKRDAAMSELRALGEQRDSVAATLAELRETLGQALGLVVPPAAEAAAEPDAGPGAQAFQPEDRGADEDEHPADGSPSGAGETLGSLPAGDLHAGDLHGGDSPIDGPAAGGVDFEETVVILDTASAARTGSEADPASEAVTDDDGDGGIPEADTNGADADGADGQTDWWAGTVDSRPPFDAEACEEPVTGEIAAVGAQSGAAFPAGADHTGSDDPEFEAKLEAWVSEGAKHFRRM